MDDPGPVKERRARSYTVRAFIDVDIVSVRRAACCCGPKCTDIRVAIQELPKKFTIDEARLADLDKRARSKTPRWPHSGQLSALVRFVFGW